MRRAIALDDDSLRKKRQEPGQQVGADDDQRIRDAILSADARFHQLFAHNDLVGAGAPNRQDAP